jgi:polyketide synthase 12/myxalamid-type polyketide synthase MxaB
VVARAEAQGLGAIDPERGLRVLEHTMTVAAAQVAVLPIQWSLFAAAAGARGRLFDLVADGGAVKTVVAARTAPVINPAAWLADVPPGRLRPMLLDRVHQEAVRVMRLAPGDSINLRQPLSELGLDSLMAVELRNALSALTERTLSGTLLFNYPTIGELVDHLTGEIEGAARPDESAKQAPSADHGGTDDIDALSTDDLAKLLAARLQEM